MPEQLPDGVCRVLEYELKLNLEITLPRFKSDREEVLKAAEPLAEKLKAAELKRGRIAVDQADQLGRWLVGQTFQCGPMGNKVRGRFNQVMKDIQQAMENYGGDGD